MPNSNRACPNFQNFVGDHTAELQATEIDLQPIVLYNLSATLVPPRLKVIPIDLTKVLFYILNVLATGNAKRSGS